MTITPVHVTVLFLLGILFFFVDFLFLRWSLPVPFLEDARTGKTLRLRWHIKYLVLVIVFFSAVTIYLNVSTNPALSNDINQQFGYLADAFLHGKVAFLEPPGSAGWYDTVEVDGQHYWPLGPFPAVLLMPFVFLGNLVGQMFMQAYLQPVQVAVVFYLVYQIARRFQYARYDSVVWGFTFTFASSFLGIALYSWSGFFAHATATLLILAALLEYSGQRRYWLIGLLMAAVLATRLTAALVALFFFFDLLFFSAHTHRDKLIRAAQLVAPLALAVLLIALYNHARFGSFTETGYSYQSINRFLTASRAHGMFALAHVPGNLFRLVFAGPTPVYMGDGSQVLRFPFMEGDVFGMSLFLTSPVLLYLFGLRYPDRRTWLLFATALVVSLPVLLYYGVGYMQLGNRYALDFLPLLFYALIQHYGEQRGRLSRFFRILVVLSALLNFYWWLTIFVDNLMTA